MKPMLAGVVDYVIGVDTHRDTHTAAVLLAATGGAAEQVTVPTNRDGFAQLSRFADKHATGSRVWAIEGTGSYGRSLTTALLGQGEWVVEIDRPTRPARRDGGKSDELDAVRAAREALSRTHLAVPRARGDREALRVLMVARRGAVKAHTQAVSQLKALLISAPQTLRDHLRDLSTAEQAARCTRLRPRPEQGVEYQMTVQALRGIARRAQALQDEADGYEKQLEQLVQSICPALLERPGIGPITAAQFLISWSHHNRIRSSAAFAALAGVAPIPASSGTTVRYRLNRSGDRQLNCALHTVALSRLAHHTPTKEYAARRAQEHKTSREIHRCLKHAIAREVYHLLQTHATKLTRITATPTGSQQPDSPLPAPPAAPAAEVKAGPKAHPKGTALTTARTPRHSRSGEPNMARTTRSTPLDRP